MSIKAVIFDWDGVLVNSVSSYFAVFRRILEKHGGTFREEYHNRFNGPTIQEIFQTVKDEQQLSFDVDEAVRERNAILDQELRNAPLFTHAADVIAALRARGLKTAVASGAPRSQIDQNLITGTLQMDAVITAEDVTQGKPHPEVYLRAAERLGVRPEECIAVEDSPVGVQAARKAGMQVIGITHTTTAEALAEADRVITDLRALEWHADRTRPHVAALIQARLGSSRFPEKVLQRINGVPMLQFLVSRLRRARGLDGVVIATTTNPKDDPLVAFCKEQDWMVFRGSEDDVLDRYYQAAKAFGIGTVIRITADCPLVDPAIVDQLIDDFQKGGADYVCNVHPPTYPDGMDVEVFSFDALERAWKISREKPNLALVTGHILNHPDQFKIRNVRNDQDLSAYRLTVDYPQDLEMVSKLCSLIRKDSFGLRDIMAALADHPELRELNAKFKRNEGMILDMQKYAGKKP